MSASTNPIPQEQPGTLDQALSYQAVLNVLADVCHAIDSHDGAAWAALYTDDGVFAYAPAPGTDNLFELVGREALVAWHVHHRSTTPVGKQNHLTLNPVVTVTGDTATSRSYFVSLREVDGAVVPASTGRYEDRLRRDADGRWRLSCRLAIGDMPRRS